MSNKKIWWVYPPKITFGMQQTHQKSVRSHYQFGKGDPILNSFSLKWKDCKKDTPYFKMRMKKRRWLGWKMWGESFTVNPNFRTKHIVGMHYLDAYIPHTLDNHGARNQAIARATLLICLIGLSLLSKDSLPSVFKEQDYNRPYQCYHK